MKTNWTQSLVGAMALAALGMIAPSMTWAVDFFDNFDNDPLGSPPTGWTMGGQTAGNVVNSQFVSSSNSVALITPLDFNSGSSYMYRTDLVNTPTGPFAYFSNDVISVDARMTSTNQFLQLAAADTALNIPFSVRFVQGTIQAYDGASLMSLGSYTSNEWYHVEMTTTPSTIKYSVRVFDSANFLVASAADFNYSVLTAPQGLFFIQYGTVGGSPVSTTAFIDNVFVGVPEPSSVALMTLCGLVILRYRRCA